MPKDQKNIQAGTCHQQLISSVCATNVSKMHEKKISGHNAGNEFLSLIKCHQLCILYVCLQCCCVNILYMYPDWSVSDVFRSSSNILRAWTFLDLSEFSHQLSVVIKSLPGRMCLAVRCFWFMAEDFTLFFSNRYQLLSITALKLHNVQ